MLTETIIYVQLAEKVQLAVDCGINAAAEGQKCKCFGYLKTITLSKVCHECRKCVLPFRHLTMSQ